MNRTIRTMALALLAFGGGAFAADYRHPATGLVFPETLAGMARISVHDYEPDTPGLGISVGYQAPGTAATIYLYTMGREAIPDGTDAPEVQEHFRQVIGDIVAHGQASGHERLRKTAERVAAYGRPGAQRMALAADFRYSLQGETRRSKVDLLGWQNHFLKVRYTYDAGVREEAERRHAELMDILADRLQPAPADGNGPGGGGPAD